MNINYHYISDIGDRKENQDACAILRQEDYILLALADGMGSYIDSKKAADCFCEICSDNSQHTPIDSNNIDDNLREYFRSSVDKIPECMQGKGAENTTPYSTGVLAYIDKTKTVIAHMGDSRAYFIRPDAIGHTQDHSVAQLLVNQGVISQEEASTHPSQSQLLRYLAKQPLEIEITHFPPLDRKSILLLCSDGLWPYMSEDELCLLLKDKELDLSLDKIITKVKQRAKGYSDNITIQIVRLT